MSVCPVTERGRKELRNREKEIQENFKKGGPREEGRRGLIRGQENWKMLKVR